MQAFRLITPAATGVGRHRSRRLGWSGCCGCLV